VYLGKYKTAEESFYAYKKEKEKYIKYYADLYKNNIPEKLYRAMMDYEVDIND